MGRTPTSTAITFDMLRAFDVLAQTLNLSDTAEQLGVTRQTARRHISDLESFLGGPLFGLQRQSYVLTQRGKCSLPGARSMLRQAERWSRGELLSAGGLQHLEYARFESGDGSRYFCQQHPVSTISLSGTPLLRQTLKAWGAALAQIEAPEMADMRPFLAVYRRSHEGWVCVEIGEDSTYARWFGWTWAKSAVGRLSDEDHAGNSYNSFIADAYDRIHGEGGVRYDHTFAYLPRENSEHPVPVTFQRLLMGCVFPDGEPALAVLTSVTEKVNILGLNAEEKESVSRELLQEFEVGATQ